MDEKSLSFLTIKHYFIKVRQSRTDRTQAERSRRSVDFTSPEIFDDMVINDRRVKVREIARLWASPINGYITYFIPTFGHEKAIPNIGTAVAYN